MPLVSSNIFQDVAIRCQLRIIIILWKNVVIKLIIHFYIYSYFTQTCLCLRGQKMSGIVNKSLSYMQRASGAHFCTSNVLSSPTSNSLQ